jgi:ABC-type spermidine/putrescine transport system permease subunit I
LSLFTCLYLSFLAFTAVGILIQSLITQPSTFIANYINITQNPTNTTNMDVISFLLGLLITVISLLLAIGVSVGLTIFDVIHDFESIGYKPS